MQYKGKEVSVVCMNTNKDTCEKKFENSISLKEMQELVGGYIEPVHINQEEVMIVNEEGKVNNLPINLTATQYLHSRDILKQDVIHGNVFVMKLSDWIQS